MTDIATFTTGRLFGLLGSGTLSTCVAIMTYDSPDLDWMSELGEKAKTHFQSVYILQLGNGSMKSFSGDSSALLLIYGLEHCDPQSPEAHSVRSSLDVQRDKGIASVICLDEAAYKKHFCDKASPLYKFCCMVEQDSLCDLTNTATRNGKA